MNRKKIGNAANEQKPNEQKPDLDHQASIRDFVVANGTFMASTPPNGPAGYPTHRGPYSTPTGTGAHTIAHPTVNNGTMRTRHYNPVISHFNTPNLPSAPGHNMQPDVPQSHPDGQKYPFVQHFHNVGVVVSSPQAGVPPNTAPRMRPQVQMFENPHPIAVANQTAPSADASFMAQPPQAPQQAQPVIPQQAQPVAPQQAQPAAPQKSMEQLIKDVEILLDQDGLQYGNYIGSFAENDRIKVAMKRLNLEPTPDLARDVPTTNAQVQPLKQRIYLALTGWVTRVQPGASKMAMNKLNGKKALEYESKALDILVFEPTRLVRVETS